MKIFPLWLFAFCSVSFLAFGQGSLTPPPGAPGPTMKTLDQVEARTPLGQPIAPATLPIFINSPGSYYLTGNVTAPSGYTSRGIVVMANDVTIDLNGFTLTGVSGSGAGVYVFAANTTILNGTIRDWSACGIDGTLRRNVHVENIRAISNGVCGIKVDANGVVSHCLADANTGTGILGTTSCLITHCQTSGTTGSPGNGIQVGTGSVITDSISNGDVVGMQMATDAQLSNCRVMNPTGDNSGFAFGNHCIFDRCTATLPNGSNAACFDGNNGGGSNVRSSNCVFRGCSGSGSGTTTSTVFLAGPGSTFENCNATGTKRGFEVVRNGSDIAGTANASFANCTATGNNEGFRFGEGSTLANCSAGLNTGTNFFGSGNNCTLIGCSASGGSGHASSTGYLLLNGCTVNHCSANGHSGDGFQFNANCLLIGNTSTSNLGDGFPGTSTNNRIDGNLALSNGAIGIHSFSATADQIVRNTSIGNATQYSPATGNNVGPTTGNPATSTSPWANF